jgi:hypothetical protein
MAYVRFPDSAQVSNFTRLSCKEQKCQRRMASCNIGNSAYSGILRGGLLSFWSPLMFAFVPAAVIA